MSHLFLSTILLLGFALSASWADQSDQSLGPGKDDPIYKQLFDQLKESNLEPSKSLELLKELEKKCSSLTDDGSQRLKLKVSNLIKISNVSDENCGKSHFLKILTKTEENKGSPNIIDYLHHYWLEQSGRCQSLLHETLERDLSELTEQERETLILLRDNILAATNGKYRLGKLQTVDYRAIRDGILKMMEQNLGPKLKPSDGTKAERRKNFVEQFERIVGSVCSKIKQDFAKLTDLYDIFCDEMDATDVEIYEGACFCHNIVANQDFLHAACYAKSKSPNSLFGKLAHIFTRN